MKVLLSVLITMVFITSDFAQNANVYKTKVAERVITVGGKGSDIQGFTNGAIQAAVCALTETGGTVKLTPGVFEIIAPVRLSSNVNLAGSGAKTVLKISEAVSAHYIDDADYGEYFVKVDNPQGFRVGMAVQIRDKTSSSCWDVSTAWITAIEGDTIYFDDGLIRDYKVGEKGIISNATSGVEVVEAENVIITNLTIDGNREKSARMDGCRGAGVYAFKAKNVTIKNVEVKNYYGEAISWQITENVTVSGCNIHNNAFNGCHPGTGSPNTLIEKNNIYDNDKDGIFICWRVKHSTIRDNQIYNNGNGICTGHKDTDVLFENNHIYNNRESGVKFREGSKRNAPHNNTFIGNIIENNGRAGSGYGFLLLGTAENLVLKNNIIRDTGKGTQKAAIFYGKDSLPAKMEGNKISGHPQGDIIKEK
jgi:hypothetical protein